jgi:hypothetical protein
MLSVAILIGLTTISAVNGGQLYDQVKSYVTVLNHRNFDMQVTNNRQKGISVVHFYKEDGNISFIL